MRLFVPVFKLYRMVDADAVWWRLLSPRGHGIARSATAESSVDAARASLAGVVDAFDRSVPSFPQTGTSRWRWVLALDGEPVVWGLGEHDRRERSERACLRFGLLAPLADVEPAASDWDWAAELSRAPVR